MDRQKLTVSGLSQPVTVKDFLLRTGYSVTLIKRVKYGGILLFGEPVTVRKTVTNGDEIEIVLRSKKSSDITPMNIDIRVIYEDEYLVALDKPTNMPTHPSRGNSLPTLANAVMGMYGEDFTFRAINRLDRDTSGIVIVAKDQHTASILSRDMKAGKFKKKYRCLVAGLPKASKGLIDAPIERECEGSIKRVVREDGKHALTEYKVIEYDGKNSLLEIILHTGRTHQIRVHMAHIGVPLVNDFLYGTVSDNQYFLRCVEIKLPHPITKEMLVLKA